MKMFDKSYNETFHHNEKKLAICKILLEKGANPNLRGGYYPGFTPIRYAIDNSCLKNNYYDIIKLLLEGGCDLTILDAHGDTILHSAVYNKKFELAKFLVQQGVDPNLRNEYGDTILHYAAWCDGKGDISLVEFLIKNKANLDVINDHDNTPLYHASCNKNPAIFEILLQNKADVSITGKSNKNIFHIAVYNNEVDKVNLLLKHKIDVNLKDQDGRTPIYCAAEKDYNKSSEDNLRIIKLLLEAGADLNITDIFGLTPLTYAQSEGHLAMVNLILEWQKKQEIDGNARK